MQPMEDGLHYTTIEQHNEKFPLARRTKIALTLLSLTVAALAAVVGVQAHMLSKAASEQQQQQEAKLAEKDCPAYPQYNEYASNGILDAEQTFINRFNGIFAPKFLSWAAALGGSNVCTGCGQIEAVRILGFPPTAVPVSGHVTHDFMTQRGGMHTREDSLNYKVTDPQWGPAAVQSAAWKNSAPSSQTQTFSYEKSTSTTKSVTVSAGLKTTVSESTEVGAGVFKASEAMSVEVSLNVATTTSETHTSAWKYGENVGVVPYSFTNITCFVVEGTVDTPFVSKRVVTDTSNIGWVFYDSQVNQPGNQGNDPGWWFWMVQPQQTGMGLRSMARTVGLTECEIEGMFNFQITGTYTGVYGARVQCEVNACDVNACPDHCDAKEAQQHPPKLSAQRHG